MEQQIFYWTGVVIWWIICVILPIGILCAVIFAITRVYFIVYEKMWQWKAAAYIMKNTELTHPHIFEVMSKSGVMEGHSMDETLRYLKEIQEWHEKLQNKH